MEATDKKIPISVYAESTPNPATMKFVCSLAFTEAGSSVEFHNVGETSKAPLAARLFTFPFAVMSKEMIEYWPKENGVCTW